MAATTLTTTNFTNSSDANFRAWVSAIINAIIAAGWVQTSDTGQINVVTVTAPAAVNTIQGYAMFRSNDAGGGLNEFLVKLEFGSGGTSANRPSITVTVGWTTDGAGTFITLPKMGPLQTCTNATPAGASISINVAAGAGYICIAATSSLAGESLMFSVERTRDASLNFQNTILFLSTATTAVFGGGSGGFSMCMDRNNAFPYFIGATFVNCFAIPSNANTPIAAKAALGLVFGFAPGATSPSMNVFGVEASALGSYQETITVPILGVNHLYRIQRDILFAGKASTVLLTRYE